jgi:hypothetical protein
VFDHRLRSAGDEFLSLILRIVKSKALASSASALSLRFATLGAEAGLLGVGIQVLDKYFSIPVVTATLDADTTEKPSRKRVRHS